MTNKYKNKKCEFDGIGFDSKSEMEFYKLMKEKEIDIIIKPTFELIAKFKKSGVNHRAINYIGDFQIMNKVIDIKGFPTPVFKLKKKLFEYKYQDLELIQLVKCPVKYKQHQSIYEGFIEIEELEKLRRLSKKKI